MNLKEIKEICNQLGIVPSKKLGQNFLINEDVVEKILQAGELSKSDTVLEIGPGLGVLTWKLAKRIGKLILIEKDKSLFDFLSKEIKGYKRYKDIKLINEDILKVETRQCLVSTDATYKIISNLPYQITSPVLWKFLAGEKSLRASRMREIRASWKHATPSLMVLMLQKEVGERILAKPGKMSLLSVLCQFYAEVEKVCDVGRGNFWPMPEVDSIVIKLKLYGRNKPAPCGTWSQQIDENEFFRIVKIGFSHKRKMLKNNLAGGLKIDSRKTSSCDTAEKIIQALKNCGLNEKVRAQELGVEEWKELYKKLSDSY